MVARSMDALLRNLSNRLTSVERRLARTRSAATAPAPVEGLDIVTALPGWKIDASSGQRLGNIAFIEVEFIRTGSAITAPANGDITNQDVGILASGWIAGSRGYPLAAGSVGPLVTGRVWGSGLYFTAVAPGVTIPTGASFALGGSYILAPG